MIVCHLASGPMLKTFTTLSWMTTRKHVARNEVMVIRCVIFPLSFGGLYGIA